MWKGRNAVIPHYRHKTKWKVQDYTKLAADKAVLQLGDQQLCSEYCIILPLLNSPGHPSALAQPHSMAHITSTCIRQTLEPLHFLQSKTCQKQHPMSGLPLGWLKQDKIKLEGKYFYRYSKESRGLLCLLSNTLDWQFLKHSEHDHYLALCA